MPAKLSTHVLDLTTGKPAAGMRICLLALDLQKVLKDVTTDADGRTAEPMLAADQMRTGEFRLLFYVRDYFQTKGVACDFLETVAVDFHITDATVSYHVPLLVTPWSYSTYRGS